MSKSPDAAPVDYATWGCLKQRLNKQKIENSDELKKIRCEWKKIDQTYIDKVSLC